MRKLVPYFFLTNHRMSLIRVQLNYGLLSFLI
jgi:hypothetical protein